MATKANLTLRQLEAGDDDKGVFRGAAHQPDERA